MSINNLSVFCADVGSIRNNKFGWAANLASGNSLIKGSSITEFADLIASEISADKRVAIGFECPLFVPVRNDPVQVNSARSGEGNRSWSAGAGTGALATGIVEVLWVMNSVNDILGHPPKASFNWNDFISQPSILLWEAFVTAQAKGTDHAEDAVIAVNSFLSSLPKPEAHNAIQEESVLSLVGACALRAGWSDSIAALSQPCIVIKA